MISAKLTTPGLPKVKLFWNKGYYVVTFAHEVTGKVLSCDFNYIFDIVMWPKFDNSGISMREVIITSIL